MPMRPAVFDIEVEFPMRKRYQNRTFLRNAAADVSRELPLTRRNFSECAALSRLALPKNLRGGLGL